MLTPKNSSKKRARSKRVDAPVGKQQYMDKEETTKPSRVDAPAGKQQYMDKEESTKPSRVDAPAGKQQYMDKEEPTKPSRVDAPAGKQQYMDKEESTKPSRVDAPVGKQQYMDKEEPTKPSRVDAPAGKGQYMDSEEKPNPTHSRPSGQNTQSSSSSRPHRTDYPGQSAQGTTHRPIRTDEQHLDKDALAAADKTTVSVYYMVTATSFGNYKAKVLDLMVGKDRTRKDSEYVAPFTCSYCADKNVFELVENISLLGAKLLVKKTIIIDIPLVSM
jgi:hypothetical protein